LGKNSVAVGELPKFTPSSKRTLWNAGNAVTNADSTVTWPSTHGTDNILSLFNTIGGDELHNNISPAISAYIWRRTA
jgi:hypothetical protein